MTKIGFGGFVMNKETITEMLKRVGKEIITKYL